MMGEETMSIVVLCVTGYLLWWATNSPTIVSHSSVKNYCNHYRCGLLHVAAFSPAVLSNRWRRDVFGRKCMMSWEEVQVAPALPLALAGTTKSEYDSVSRLSRQFNRYINRFIIRNVFLQAGAALWKTYKRRRGQTSASKQTTEAI